MDRRTNRGEVESSPRWDEQDLLLNIDESIQIGEFEMDQQVVVTKTCPRCGGSGRYSFNLRDADRCYGCGGTGKVPCAPKGQKRIKPTCDDYKKAVPGDIVSIACVLYRVEEIKWLKPIIKGWDLYNQQMKVTRLVDGKELYIKREFAGYDPDSESSWDIDLNTGVKSTGCTVIHTPEHLIGTLYEPEQYGERCRKVIQLSPEELTRYRRPLRG